MRELLVPMRNRKTTRPKASTQDGFHIGRGLVAVTTAVSPGAVMIRDQSLRCFDPREIDAPAARQRLDSAARMPGLFAIDPDPPARCQSRRSRRPAGRRCGGGHGKKVDARHACGHGCRLVAALLPRFAFATIVNTSAARDLGTAELSMTLMTTFAANAAALPRP